MQCVISVVISTALDVMKKIRFVFICITLLWALHTVTKQQFFTFILSIFYLYL